MYLAVLSAMVSCFRQKKVIDFMLDGLYAEKAETS